MSWSLGERQLTMLGALTRTGVVLGNFPGYAYSDDQDGLWSLELSMAIAICDNVQHAAEQYLQFHKTPPSKLIQVTRSRDISDTIFGSASEMSETVAS
jgi:hypothetical protein